MDKVNLIGVCLRSVQEVKDKWQGMVGNAKKEHSQKIIELFGDDPLFSGITGGISQVIIKRKQIFSQVTF